LLSALDEICFLDFYFVGEIVRSPAQIRLSVTTAQDYAKALSAAAPLPERDS